MSKAKYLNFPIQLLEGFMIDKSKCLNNILYYALYVYSFNFEEEKTELKKINCSAKHFSVDLGDPNKALSIGKMYYNSLPVSSPKVGIELKIFWDYHKNYKTEFENACLLAFLALKSIIGSKDYCKATNNYLWGRMDGKSNAILNKEELTTEIYCFANRFQTTKIISELKKWGLVYYSRYTRGFYFSFKIDFKGLVLIAEKNRESRKKKLAKANEEAIVTQVLEQIKRTPP